MEIPFQTVYYMKQEYKGGFVIVYEKIQGRYLTPDIEKFTNELISHGQPAAIKMIRAKYGLDLAKAKKYVDILRGVEQKGFFMEGVIFSYPFIVKSI